MSQVPALNSGPVGRRGRPQQSDGAVLPEERFSDALDPNQSAIDPGRDTLPGLDNFNFPPRSGTTGEAGSDPGPLWLTSSRPASLPNIWNSQRP